MAMEARGFARSLGRPFWRTLLFPSAIATTMLSAATVERTNGALEAAKPTTADSSKVVLTGAKSKHNLRAGFDKMYYILHEHRKQHLSTIAPMIPLSGPTPTNASSSGSSTVLTTSTGSASA